MTLADLQPRRTHNFLVFDCPCGKGHKQRIRVRQNYNGDMVWHIKGRLPRITMAPSVDSDCVHFSILDGQVIVHP